MNIALNIPFADISLPLWVIVSQWTLLFALGCLVFVAYRQFAYMLHLKDMGSERDGLAIGEQAPAFAYMPMHQSEGISCHFDPKGQWSLLLFADPGCVSCRDALRALERLVSELPEEMQVLVITTSESILVDAVEEFKTTSIDLGRIDRDVLLKLYRTYATPFTYVIDSEGVIQAKGIAGSEADFRKMMRRVNRSVVQVVSRSR